MVNAGWFNQRFCLLTVLEEKKKSVNELIVDMMLSNKVQNLIFRPELLREKHTYLTKEVMRYSAHMAASNT